MKNKRITLLITIMLLASQLSLGISTLATSIENSDEIEEKQEVIIENKEIQQEDIAEEENIDEEIEQEEVIEEVKKEEELVDVNVREMTDDNPKEKVTEVEEQKTERNDRATVDFSVSDLWFPLGSPKDIREKRFRDAATVTIDGKIVGKQDYGVEFATQPNTKMLSKNVSHDMLVNVRANDYNGQKSDYATYSVNYGNSIVFESGDSNKKSGAYTLHTENQSSSYKLTGSLANGSGRDLIHEDYKKKDYYSIEVFRPSKGTLLINEETPLITSITAKGNDSKESVLNQWRDLSVYDGDLVRVWCANPKANNLYTSNRDSTKIENFANEDGYVVYQVTKNGYVPILSTPLEVVEQTISTSTNDDELDKNILKSFVDIPEDVEIVGFTEYPNREKVGRSEGKVMVREQSEYTDDKVVEQIYNVPFNVEKQSLKVEIEPIYVPLGTKTELIDAKKWVTSVNYEGEELDEDDYIVEFIEEPHAYYVAEEEVEIKVSLVDNDTVSTIVKTDYIIPWEHTVISRDGTSDNDSIATAISLLEEDGKPYFGMSSGEIRDSSNGRISSIVEVDFLRKNSNNELLKLKSEGAAYPSQTIEKWMPQIDKTNIEYGDVLRQSVLKSGENYNGEATYASRDNDTLKKETAGYSHAYYEITPDGYHLLELNQLEVKKNIPEFEQETTKEEMNKTAIDQFNFPDDIKDKNNFRFEYDSVDTSTPGKKETKMNVYEKLITGGEFMTTYTVEYEVLKKAEEPIKLTLQSASLPVGTKSEFVKPEDYVKSVAVGEQQLSTSEYKVSFVDPVNTQVVGKQPTKIKVELKEDNRSIIESTETSITWNHSVVTKSADDKIDASVSLLDNQGKPYLVANEGSGLSTANLSSRPFLYVYRGNTNEALISSGYESVGQAPDKTMNKWNKELETQNFQYGDVLGYKVNKYNSANASEMGAKTWTSRDEKLVKETEGYDLAYYEMTREGYRLMQLNQLEINPKLISVNQGTTKEEMNTHAADAMVIPKHIKNSEDYRFEFASVDTKTSGKKQTKMNVYEKLNTGGEFMSTYDVEYVVNPQVTEQFFNSKGKKLQKEIKTDFDFNTTYQVKPNNYLTIDSELYVYQGWLLGDKKPGKDKPTEGQPPEAKDSITYQYIYKSADNMIDMTIPTELLFGTEDNSSEITSKAYKIKNNSKEISTEVILGDFKKEASDVKLLKKTDKDPTNQELTARLNLMADQQIVINSLTEKTKNQPIKKLEPEASTDINLSGQYFGPLETGVNVKYQMGFKFKATK